MSRRASDLKAGDQCVYGRVVSVGEHENPRKVSVTIDGVGVFGIPADRPMPEAVA